MVWGGKHQKIWKKPREVGGKRNKDQREGKWAWTAGFSGFKGKRRGNLDLKKFKD